MSEVSKLKVYSLGVVAMNKALKSKIIEVTPTEDAPMTDGQLSDNATTITSKSQDASGKPFSVSVQATNTVKATWLPMGSSNRVTAPDVRRGERVVLYRFGDSDKFWWSTLHDDMNLRKLETVVYAFSGTQNEGDDTTGDNSYFFEVSTHQGLIAVHTSKANGELFAYDVQINGKSGIIQIQDDSGNVFFLNSVEHQFMLKNVDNTSIFMDKKNLSFNVPETLTINAKAIKTTATTSTASISGDNKVTSGTTEITGGSGVTISSPNTEID